MGLCRHAVYKGTYEANESFAVTIKHRSAAEVKRRPPAAVERLARACWWETRVNQSAEHVHRSFK